MHENISNSVIFYSHYTEGGVNKTGLTVTIDVYEVIRDGTATLVVDDGACTEIGAGLYRYLLAAATVDAAAEYVGVFHTATATVDAQDIPAIWVINRAGTNIISTLALESTLTAIKGATWSTETLVALKTAIDAIATWASAAISASYASGAISDIRGSSWSIAMTDLTLDTNKQQFCIKRKAQDKDEDAILFVDSATGLIYINGAAGTASDATLVYAGTTLTLTVKTAATAQLPVGTFHYGVQYVTAAGLVEEPYGGTFSITADIVRATT